MKTVIANNRILKTNTDYNIIVKKVAKRLLCMSYITYSKSKSENLKQRIYVAKMIIWSAVKIQKDYSD